MGYVIFNGISSKDVGLEVESYPEYASPKRKYSTVTVPGRNGDLIIDEGAWENTTRSYSVSVGSLHRRYTDMVNRVTEWLHSTNTYARLEDSYEPEYYRMAVFLEAINFSNIVNQGAKATVEFNCKPQRFLKSGEEVLTLKNGATILNPTGFPSFPLLQITGTGSGRVVIGTYSVDITDIGGSLTIDCDMLNAYSGTMNKNSVIKLGNPTFPRIEPGDITIGYSGGITKLEVTPRWYTI